MSIAQLVDEVVVATDDELGDVASITDGTNTVPAAVGFFRREFDEATSDQYAVTVQAASFELRTTQLDGLLKSTVGKSLRLDYGGYSYLVMDIRYGPHGLALLVLSR